MGNHKKRKVPPPGDRTPRGQREGDIVPVPLSSSSDEGLPTGLAASPVDEGAIARGDELRVYLTRLPPDRSLGGSSDKIGENRHMEEDLEVVPDEEVECGEDCPETGHIKICPRGISFGDGTDIAWEKADVSPVYDWVFARPGANEDRTDVKNSRIAGCLVGMSLKMLDREIGAAVNAFVAMAVSEAGAEGRRRWLSVMQYVIAALSEQWRRIACEEAEVERMKAEVERLGGMSSAPTTSLPSVKGGGGVHPERVDVAVQTPASGPEPSDSPEHLGEPLVGVLGRIASRLDALERKMDGRSDRPLGDV